MGYRYTEVTRELVDGKMKITKKVTKEMPPDTTAIIWWQKNRDPDNWRDRREIRHDGNLKIQFDSVIYEAVHGNGSGRSGDNGNGHGKPAAAILDN